MSKDISALELRAIEAEARLAALTKRIEELEKRNGGKKEQQQTQEQEVKEQSQPEEEKIKKNTFHVPQAQIRDLFAKPDLNPDEKFTLVRTVGEECVQDEELRALFKRKENPICYDGFEPSGRMHIAQGVLKAINVNKCTKAGCTFIFWVADWFALLNNKMGGDLAKIRTVGNYMIEVWKACGMDMTRVKFIWSSDEINSHSNEYWLRVMDISRKFYLPRIKRCSQIMGREKEKELYASQIFYPCMQCADIFHLKADICQLGLDQRKVNMLAREYCDEVGIKNKPIILSHHMIMGLGEGEEKMSKSKPDSAIFMEDSPDDVKKKINKAFCPPKIIDKNPCFDYLKHIVFQKFPTFSIERPEKYGGNKTYNSYEEVVEDYENEKLHPGDLKPALTKAINAIIAPVQQHFQTDPQAKELLKKVQQYMKELYK